MELSGTRRFRGDYLRDARKARGWSQSRLAFRIGAHVTSVSDWERGDNAPSGRHVAGLARELGVPAERFYGDSDDDEEAAQMPLSRDEYAIYGEMTARIIAGRVA